MRQAVNGASTFALIRTDACWRYVVGQVKSLPDKRIDGAPRVTRSGSGASRVVAIRA